MCCSGNDNVSNSGMGKNVVSVCSPYAAVFSSPPRRLARPGYLKLANLKLATPVVLETLYTT